MKKSLLLTLFLLIGIGFSAVAHAQQANYALIDMQYLSEKIPAYKKASEHLQKETKKYEQEIEALRAEAKKLYLQYQQEMGRLTPNQRTEREERIIAVEERSLQLQEKYFGPKGELAKAQEQFIKPIQDKIYEAVKLISVRRGYLMVLDRASLSGVIYADPQADISNDVLAVLGVSE